MEKGDSPSPALSNYLNQPDEELGRGFQHLIQHNAATTPYNQPDQQQVDIGSHIGSNPQSRYSSPGPQTNMMNMYEHHTPINHASPYGPPPYTGGYQTAYPVIETTPYPQLPDLGSSTTSHNAYSTPATSPPTPVPAEGITTRSGRSIMRPSTVATLTRPSRVERPAPRSRPKKRKHMEDGDAFPKPRGISLANPLSQLVKDITNVEDTDIQAYVTRSPEERRREVAQSKTGKVKRPMNAFMLYRKAYQNRTKEWKRLDGIRRKEESTSEGKPEKGHDNHQVISQVCGLSWNMEPQELRDQYDEWAKIERNNHKLAFPDYKFAPAKSKIKKPGGAGGGGGSGSRHGDRDSDDDNASNLDSYDFHDWGQSGSGPPSRNATRAPRYLDPDGDYLLPHGYSASMYRSRSPNPNVGHLQTAYAQHMHNSHLSSFQYSNPGKPRPAEYGSGLGHGQYYQQSTEFTQQSYPHHGGGGGGTYSSHQGIPAFVENVYINKTNSPGSSFHGSPVLDNHRAYNELILPSNSHASQLSRAAMMYQQAHHMHRHPVEHQIDPLLMSTHQESGGRGGAGDSRMGPDLTFDSLGILQSSDFTDGLSTYPLDQGIAGLGGSHTASPHPQQFEQAFHTPNETAPTAGEGSDPASKVTESSWQDEDASGTGVKLSSTDWEAALGAAAEFQLEDIDQILGTTTASP